MWVSLGGTWHGLQELSTRSIPKTRRGVEWRILLLALALILNYTLKHTVKSFGTKVYNQPLECWLHTHLSPLTGPAVASLSQQGPRGDLHCLGQEAWHPNPWTHLPVPPRDLQLPACRGGWRGRWGRWLHTTEPEIGGKKERKGQTGLKKPHPALEQEENADGWFGALLASLRHQAGALLLLWVAAAPQIPHSPPSLPTPKPPAPAWHRPGKEVSEHGGAQGLEGERKARGKIPKEGEKETYLSALVIPGQAGWPCQCWRDVKHFKRWLCTARCPYQ